MRWVLRRIEDGKYVARPGEEKSYVSNIRDARRFRTRKVAEADACGNERPWEVPE